MVNLKADLIHKEVLFDFKKSEKLEFLLQLQVAQNHVKCMFLNENRLKSLILSGFYKSFEFGAKPLSAWNRIFRSSAANFKNIHAFSTKHVCVYLTV